MSSRTTSEHGSLGERVERMNVTPKAGGAKHVEARDDTGQWQPALLLRWERHGATWWGRVVMLDADEPSLIALAAPRLRPVGCSCCG